MGRHGLDPKPAVPARLRRWFPGTLTPPFNDDKRAEAGLPLDLCRTRAGDHGAAAAPPA